MQAEREGQQDRLEEDRGWVVLLVVIVQHTERQTIASSRAHSVRHTRQYLLQMPAKYPSVDQDHDNVSDTCLSIRHSASS